MNNKHRVKLNTMSESLFQYDKGQILVFDDIPNGSEIQFSNNTKRIITSNEVAIPDVLLETAGAKRAFVQVIKSDSETTVYTVGWNVIPRPLKGTYVAPAEEQSFREQMQEIMEETEEIAQSVRDDADAGKFNGTDYNHSAEYAALTAQMAQYQQQVNTDRASIDQSVATALGYKNDASDSADSAELSAQRAEQVAVNNGYFYFNINDAGHLIYTRTDNVNQDLTFALNQQGELEVTYV